MQIILEGVGVPVSVTVDGRKADWKYSGKDLAVVITIPEAAASKETVVKCEYGDFDPSILRGKKGIFHRMMAITPEFKDAYNTVVDKYKLLSRPFLKVAQCPSRIDTDPSRLKEYLEGMDLKAVEDDLKAYPGLERMNTAIQAQCKL